MSEIGVHAKDEELYEEGNISLFMYDQGSKCQGGDVDQIPVVREFGDVFPEEILGMPHSREVEFTIADFSDCTYFKSTYRMAPKEMQEMKESVEELLNKGVAFLRHIISKERVSFDPSKVQVVMDWHVPMNMAEVQSFLGLTGYYRKFVKDFSKIAKPLTNLMEKVTRF
ncbi:uncharacterized protein LOC116026973 [Ipomoea triloba]|uniref:uncharacterized protein LOC116026973 n=1 Tax=Ipomoea triloba TaxID=35885 RepID=UPI00125D423C|nr:uncharacterized protein LOC116026973 [Ipomoea triloba]